MIKGVVFDVDGVLTDTEPYHYSAWRQVLEKYGIQLTREGYKELSGNPSDYLDRMLIDRYNLKIPYGTLATQKKEIVYNLLKEEPIRPKPGVPDIILKLKGEGLLIGVASATSREELILKLRKINIIDYLDVIVSEDEVSRSKPNPDIYLRAFTLLGIKPEEGVVVEDTPTGARAGKASGALVIAVPNQYLDPSLFPFVDYVCNDLYCVEKVIEEINHSTRN